MSDTLPSMAALIAIDRHAADELRFIRMTMERAGYASTPCPESV